MDNKCQALKKDGTNCQNFSLKGFVFCKVHWKQSEKIVDDDKQCLICFDKGPLFELNCKHFVHLDCISQMINPNCPVCRTPLENIPKIIKKKITIAGDKFRKEQNEEMFSEFINSQSNQETLKINQIFTEIPITLQFLRLFKIPSWIFPSKIEIQIGEDQPSSPMGYFCTIVLQNVYKTINKIIVDSDDCSDDFTDELDEDLLNDTEDPSVIIEYLMI